MPFVGPVNVSKQNPVGNWSLNVHILTNDQVVFVPYICAAQVAVSLRQVLVEIILPAICIPVGKKLQLTGTADDIICSILCRILLNRSKGYLRLAIHILHRRCRNRVRKDRKEREFCRQIAALRDSKSDSAAVLCIGVQCREAVFIKLHIICRIELINRALLINPERIFHCTCQCIIPYKCLVCVSCSHGVLFGNIFPIYTTETNAVFSTISSCIFKNQQVSILRDRLPGFVQQRARNCHVFCSVCVRRHTM